ncbi:MAG: TetR family transcriptional regulator, partial [Streptosporangiaceae bacterium]|nr:TetR family transcriptional regulator [Streptosporangiaceae bacterium]
MGHREDLLAGAVRCLREKGYSRTTARDIVAASGTNLGSIGYHYGSTEALLNAAVMQAIDEFGIEMARAMATEVDPGATALERFEQYWTRVIDSFAANRQVWLATFDVFGLIERVPQVHAALAQGLQDGRMA